MTNYEKRLASLTASVSSDTKEYKAASNIIAHNANQRRFKVSLDSVVPDKVPWSWDNANISNNLRKKLKV